MFISFFTPTHNTKYLQRLAKSIESQTCKDFEWIICPNGEAEINFELPMQAKVIPYEGEKKIGAIKHFAAMHGKGDILAEVDHDDELTPDCAHELITAFKEHPEADFVYSNCCETKKDKPWKYSEKYGWKYRPFQWNGTDQEECVTFDPTPASISRIWYAPNHIRSWRADFYKKIGGHDIKREILDDQDLLCRTYIEGTMHHIDKCLYVYHVHDSNSWSSKEYNEKIQTQTLELHDKYIYQLVEKWCDINNLLKIDLCGGHNKPEGYISVDLFNGDITANLEEKWPFRDGSVGLFRAHDALEHMKDPQHTMKEVYRCLAPGGWLLSKTPSTDGRGAFQDPTHKSFWNSNSFFYYTQANQNRFIDCPVRFQMTRIKNYFPTSWEQQHNIVYVKADLLKPYTDRVPGGMNI